MEYLYVLQGLCVTMSSTLAPISSLGERIKKVLELLDVIRSNAPKEKTQSLALEAKEIVEEMRTRFENCPLQQLVKMVATAEWDTAKEVLNNHFPTAQSKSDAIKQVLMALVYNEYRKLKALKWVKHLQGELQLVACEALYELIKKEPTVNQALLLRLLKYVQKYEIAVQEEMRTKLESNCCNIIDQVVKEIKTNKCSYVHGLKYFIPTILSNFDISKVESFVLLFYYCQKLIHFDYNLKVSCCIIDTLLKQALQDDSDLALHLYAYVIKQFARYGRQSDPVFQDALAELTKVKDKMVLQYQEYASSTTSSMKCLP